MISLLATVDLTQLSMESLLKLAHDYPSQEDILTVILQTLHWLASNKSNDAPSVKTIASFLA